MGLFKPNFEKMKAKKDIEGLIKVLNEDSLEAQVQATEALCEMKDEKVIQPLISLLRDSNCRFKRSVIRILGEMQCKMVVADLVEINKKERTKFTDWVNRVNDPANFINISWTFADYWETSIALANIGEENALDDLSNILKVTALVLGIGARNDLVIHNYLLEVESRGFLRRNDIGRCKDFRARAERAYENISLRS